MEKKYRLTRETIKHNLKTLYRIEALKDFRDIKGDKSGYYNRRQNLENSNLPLRSILLLITKERKNYYNFKIYGGTSFGIKYFSK